MSSTLLAPESKGCKELPVQRAIVKDVSRASLRVRSSTRTVRIGVLGLGNVGRAFVQACHTGVDLLRARGWTPFVCGALVRDESKHRCGVLPDGLITSDAEAFFDARPDVIVEVLAGAEPAARCVAEAMRRGIPVVTANKTMLAQSGDELMLLAERCGVALRCEAAVAAGVPFLSYLGSRPFADRVSRVNAILNGTSNFILTRVAESGAAFEAALAEAQRRGLAEPDATADISGRDAAAKLAVILQHLGYAGVRTEHFEIRGIDTLDAEDLRAARRFGGAIKPVAVAGVDGDSVEAFVGPAFVDGAHPLAGVGDLQNGVCVSGDVIGRVCFSGPGAGPAVTAATLLDDVADVVAGGLLSAAVPTKARRKASRIDAPRTEWFVRIACSNGTLPPLDIADLLGRHGIQTRGLRGARPGPDGSRLYVRTEEASREGIETALAQLRNTFDARTYALRAITE